MSKLLTAAEAEAFDEADVEGLITAGEYRVKIMSIEPKESNPDTKCFKFKVMSGPFRGRVLRAWPRTAPNLIWTLKRLIGEVVEDPAELQLEDLEGHIFMADVTVEERKDNGENTNRVTRLTALAGNGGEAASDDDEDPPF
jgi:hypothetical protein